MNRKRSSSILANLDSCLGQALRVTHNARPERDESTAIFILAVHLQWPMIRSRAFSAPLVLLRPKAPHAL